jgi:DNA (cytosine-5)-methyltransferase 1
MFVLSLFPGIGLLDMAFEAEGFCVVRGPDLLWGGDVRRFHPPAGVFDGVIGGPPCQAFSRLRYLVEHNGHTVAPNLIPEFERVITEAEPRWYLMENVPDAPHPTVPSYDRHGFRLDNRALGEAQSRRRVFHFGLRDAKAPDLRHWIDYAVFESIDFFPAVLAHGGQRLVPIAIGGSGRIKSTKGAAAIGYQSKEYFRLACRLQGLPEDFDLPGFTTAGKIRAIGNGVPLPMGRAIAKALRKAIGHAPNCPQQR